MANNRDSGPMCNVKEMKMRKYNLHPSGIRSDQSSIVVAAKRRPWLGGLRLRGWQ